MKRTVLAPLHEARGAQWMEHHGWEIPARFASVEQEYHALQEGVGLLDLSHRTRLRISGRDRRNWLHGQCTQDIKGLADGRAAYATIMDPRGKMVCDLRVIALPGELWLDLPAGTDTPMQEYLDHYLIMERCEIEDLSASHAQLSLQGPQSSYALGGVLGQDAASLAPGGVVTVEHAGLPVHVVRSFRCGEDGFDVYVPAEGAAPLWASLSMPRPEFAVHSVGWDAINVRRLEAGIPWWGEELDGSLVPLEARLDHAISTNKGCYVGQEIIARIEARGHVNNLLGGFHVMGDTLPPRGAEIQADGKRIGKVSTSLRSLRLNRPVGLGFFRREHHQAGAPLKAVWEGGEAELRVTPLPFVRDDHPA